MSTLGESGIRVSEGSCAGGWVPRAGSENCLVPARFEDIKMVFDIFNKGSGGWGKERKGRTEGCLEREEMMVFSKEGRMSDHRSRRKDIAHFVLRSFLPSPRLSKLMALTPAITLSSVCLPQPPPSFGLCPCHTSSSIPASGL